MEIPEVEYRPTGATGLQAPDSTALPGLRLLQRNMRSRHKLINCTYCFYYKSHKASRLHRNPP